MTFEEWKKEVDVVCVKTFGLSSDDMTDCNWYDYFESELSPFEAVECAVEEVWSFDSPSFYNLWYGSAVSEVV